MATRGCVDKALSFVYRLMNMSWGKVAAIFMGIILMLLISFSAFAQLKFRSKPWYRFPAPCKTNENVMNDMKELVFKMHKTLDSLNIPHVVCYGTLWGTLRNGEILPWDNNIDLCVNALEIVKVDRQTLFNEFSKNGMKIVYNSRQGMFKVRFGHAKGYITTFLEFLNGDMYRTGWVQNIRWWLDKKSISFPSHILEAPFQTAKLYGQDVPVPHENIELLKYLYPDDWWKEAKPPGC